MAIKSVTAPPPIDVCTYTHVQAESLTNRNAIAHANPA